MSTATLEQKRGGLAGEAFRVSLRAVWNKVGISREAERALRAWLTLGVDYVERGNGIWYSEAGVLALAQKIGEGSRQVEAGEEISTPADGSGAPANQDALSPSGVRPTLLLTERAGEPVLPVRVTVMRSGFRNVRVVEVKVNGPVGDRHFMAVRSSENFLPGMVCWAAPEAGQANWRFWGRADGTHEATASAVGPRSKGRW